MSNPSKTYTKPAGGPRGRGAASFAPIDKSIPIGPTAKRLLAYIFRDYKWPFILVVGCIIVGSLISVVSSVLVKFLINNFIEPLLLQDIPNFEPLKKAVFAAAAFFVFSIITNLAQTRTMATITQGVLRNVRNEMFDHLQTLPISYFDTNPYGDVMSHFTNDTDTLRQMLSQSVPRVIESLFTIVGVVIAMIILSPLMTTIVFFCTLLIFYITKRIGGMSGRYFVKQQRSLADINTFTEEMTNGLKVIKVFTHEDECQTIFDEKNEELFVHASKANQCANILMPIFGNIGNIQYVLIAMIGGALAIKGVGGITLGDIGAFLLLAKSFTMPVSNVSQQINSVVMALAGADRIFKLMDEPEEKDEGTVDLVKVMDVNGKPAEADPSLSVRKHKEIYWAWKKPSENGFEYIPLKGAVVFQDVDFGYVPEKQILHQVNLYAKPGQKIAFVGQTGAGKTTITNLINRFYFIQSGTITYDGIDINDIKKTALRNSLGMVLQDTNLFTDTIRENIRFGRLSATDEEIEEAAKLAGAHEFISLLPQGYDTVISGDGGLLSQGQRQLLAIARAAVANTPVMILDEATSSIDTRTESIVQAGMDNLMEGRTVFVIAHRLSTVQNSQCIMVLDQGRIIERGNHEELMLQKGKYYSLYTGSIQNSSEKTE